MNIHRLRKDTSNKKPPISLNSQNNQQTPTRRIVYYDVNQFQNTPPDHFDLISTSNNKSEKHEVLLPPISQPLLLKYRNERFKKDYFPTSNSLFSGFPNLSKILNEALCGKQNQQAISMCGICQRLHDLNLCRFATELLDKQYNWRSDFKFRSTYEFYLTKNIEIFLTDQQIMHRLQSKFDILGVILLQNHKYVLMRILKCYIKHAKYYNKQAELTLQNDIYFWFLAGIYYHIGVPYYLNTLQTVPGRQSIGIQEPMMFWLLDMSMCSLKDQLTRQSMHKNSDLLIEYCQQLYPYQYHALVYEYHVPLHQIISQFLNQLMVGFIGIQFIGFYLTGLMDHGGINYVMKVILSYLEKRIEKMEKDDIIKVNRSKNINKTERKKDTNIEANNRSTAPQQLNLTEEMRQKKQEIIKYLLNSNEEWPAIFFNTSTFEF